jgi:hypothetical protein
MVVLGGDFPPEEAYILDVDGRRLVTSSGGTLHERAQILILNAINAAFYDSRAKDETHAFDVCLG